MIVLAHEEARSLNHGHIGTEHFLLGLMTEGGGVAERVLSGLGVGEDGVRDEVRKIVGRGRASSSGHLPFTDHAKKALEYGLGESMRRGHDHIGTGHVLLGLIREGDGLGARVLEESGANLPDVRRAVIGLLPAGPGDEPEATGTSPVRAATDSITLRGLRIMAHHGVTEEERAGGQNFVVDVTAHLDLSEAGRSDDLSSTVDYGILAEAIHRRVSGERWNLIERVAERVAELVLEDNRVGRVDVTVHKPDAPIRVGFEDVAVTVVRHSPYT